MTTQIRSTEFGDWLVANISETTKATQSQDPALAGPALVRLQSLQVAKIVLRDFLKLQQKMMSRASAGQHPG